MRLILLPKCNWDGLSDFNLVSVDDYRIVFFQ